MMYCDPPRKYSKKGKRWSHLFSPSYREMRAFGKAHGLKRFDRGAFPHYDVAEDELPRLIEAGVVVVTRRELLRMMYEWRNGCRSGRLET